MSAQNKMGEKYRGLHETYSMVSRAHDQGHAHDGGANQARGRRARRARRPRPRRDQE